MPTSTLGVFPKQSKWSIINLEDCDLELVLVDLIDFSETVVAALADPKSTI